jgi:hypothetical protein
MSVCSLFDDNIPAESEAILATNFAEILIQRSFLQKKLS